MTRWVSIAAIAAVVGCTNDFDQFRPDDDDDGGLEGGSSLGTGGSCGHGYASCSGNCVEILSNEAHCGSCTKTCPPGLTCDNGSCSCPGTLELCPAGCIDITTDENHCGGCNVPCSPSETCVAGHCQ
jgi:hypothetical protein